ncbi:hypothetical protein, partial [Serratia marcescens]|uniref:hypothetical protein n=1 Tax=Serratia marcescens TaxID=615 RepID=UPI001BAEB550
CCVVKHEMAKEVAEGLVGSERWKREGRKEYHYLGQEVQSAGSAGEKQAVLFGKAWIEWSDVKIFVFRWV